MGIIMKQLRRLWRAIREKADKQFYTQMLTDVTLGMLAQLNDEFDMQTNH